ncbi:unnamed protein product [Nippostrongylus brasiliensis]|uniref:DUF5727 domain-containing protein n=1 Tax=Nippostrongylus brasiliensis TaxID=27835 RepID=A0A0N4YUG9_NIPBR|nr:unnamed protein product [Nippostrongylus brasiliensis]
MEVIRGLGEFHSRLADRAHYRLRYRLLSSADVKPYRGGCPVVIGGSFFFLRASSMYNFICRSVMWKKDNHFCILSIYNRAQRVDQFRIAVNSDIDLYENTCTYTPEAANTVKFVSDWDLERTTVPVPPLRNVTPRPRTP